MKDFSNFTNGNGGDLFLELDSMLFNQVYLALFGGNVEASTNGNEDLGEVRNDWWGNSLLFDDSEAKQMNSQTERTIYSVTLNSIGRMRIENAVKNDLNFLSGMVDYKVDVSIPKHDAVVISVLLTEKKNNRKSKMQLQFDIAKRELIINTTI